MVKCYHYLIHHTVSLQYWNVICAVGKLRAQHFALIKLTLTR